MEKEPSDISLTWVDVARLWAKVNIPDFPHHENMCWEFTGSLNRGYGQIKIKGRPMPAHRVALQFASGKVGQVACHICDNPACCNPRHLYWGTAQTNGNDVIERHPRYADLRRRRAIKAAVGTRPGGGWRKGWKMIKPGLWRLPDGGLYQTPSAEKTRTIPENTEISAGSVRLTKGEADG